MLSDKITVIIKELHFTHVGHTCKMYAVTDNKLKCIISAICSEMAENSLCI